jgi:hypothetical protein
MIDLHQATITLNAYSTSIRLQTNLRHPDADEESGKIEKRMVDLAAQTQEARVLLIMVLEEVIKYHEQLLVGYTGELADLFPAIERVRVAVAEANKVLLAHKGKSQRREPEESQSAMAIREFRASQAARRA